MKIARTSLGILVASVFLLAIGVAPSRAIVEPNRADAASSPGRPPGPTRG